jgi:hypothetical protein
LITELLGIARRIRITIHREVLAQDVHSRVVAVFSPKKDFIWLMGDTQVGHASDLREAVRPAPPRPDVV